ncbi:hypothetical protein PVK06_041730 [Gossypium arboreum]|uniref:Uncharacterized protein n=1 Tax=Gossypium arboreum TaxID=29729 RepID=A0ABR0NBW1_GOSAR|nr:hypothetical protein PVK06_041730 [Gossypium arboreum]
MRDDVLSKKVNQRIDQQRKFEYEISKENRDVVMETTQETWKSLSWKDRLMGLGLYSNEKTSVVIGSEEDEDLELTEDDVERSTINDIPSIKFSD